MNEINVFLPSSTETCSWLGVPSEGRTPPQSHRKRTKRQPITIKQSYRMNDQAQVLAHSGWLCRFKLMARTKIFFFLQSAQMALQQNKTDTPLEMRTHNKDLWTDDSTEETTEGQRLVPPKLFSCSAVVNLTYGFDKKKNILYEIMMFLIILKQEKWESEKSWSWKLIQFISKIPRNICVLFPFLVHQGLTDVRSEKCCV